MNLHKNSMSNNITNNNQSSIESFVRNRSGFFSSGSTKFGTIKSVHVYGESDAPVKKKRIISRVHIYCNISVAPVKNDFVVPNEILYPKPIRCPKHTLDELNIPSDDDSTVADVKELTGMIQLPTPVKELASTIPVKKRLKVRRIIVNLGEKNSN